MRTILIASLMTLATQVRAEEITAGKVLEHYDANDPYVSDLATSYLSGAANTAASFIALADLFGKKIVCPPEQLFINSELVASFIRGHLSTNPDRADMGASQVLLLAIYNQFPCSN